MSLSRRVRTLEDRMLPCEPPEVVLSEEDRAIAQAIVARAYADPERYADRIALFERCEAQAPAATTAAAG